MGPGGDPLFLLEMTAELIPGRRVGFSHMKAGNCVGNRQ